MGWWAERHATSPPEVSSSARKALCPSYTHQRGGLSWGAGLETELTDRIDLSADWVRHVGDEGEFEAVDAVSLGLKLYF